MPAGAVGVRGGVGHRQGHGGGGEGDGEGRKVPFHIASYEDAESFFIDSFTPPSAAQERPVQPVIPGGFARGIWLHFNVSGGTIGPATLGADFPWMIINSITLEDINGAPIVGPLTGFELYLTNKYGGYYNMPDPAPSPNFDGRYNTNFWIWVPCEIRSDGLGALANTDARAQYRLRYTIEGTANWIGTTGATTAPTNCTVRGFIERWAQVEPVDLMGHPQEVEPPRLNTTQFWSHETQNLSVSSNSTFKQNRVGSLIRTLILVFRQTSAQAAAAMANPRVDAVDGNTSFRIRLDNRYIRSETLNLRIERMYRSYGLFNVSSYTGAPPQNLQGGGGGNVGTNPAAATTIQGREAGVMVYSFAKDEDGQPSPGDIGAWLKTLETTFLQYEFTTNTINGQTGGTLTVLVNDVAVRAK